MENLITSFIPVSYGGNTLVLKFPFFDVSISVTRKKGKSFTLKKSHVVKGKKFRASKRKR